MELRPLSSLEEFRASRKFEICATAIVEKSMATAVPVAARAIESLGVCLQQEFAVSIVQRQEIELLLAEMKRMKSFLTAALKQEGKSEELLQCALGFGEVAYEVDDFADDLFYEIMRKGAAHGEEKWLSYFDLKFKEWKARFTLARLIARLTARIRDINLWFEGHVVRDAPSQWEEESDVSMKTDLWMTLRESSSPLVDDFFVGMEDEKEKLVSLLTADQKESNDVPVISIFGMGGLGKTTLAKKVYEDCRVRHHFESFAWATLGRDLKLRNVMESLLLQLCAVESREELMPSSDLDLAQRLYESQLPKKCLIILDDVWDDAWECLRIAFPSERTGSRALLTTRCRETTERIAVKKGIIHQIRYLNQEEGWELFQKTAFRDRKVDQDLLDIGKDIARCCHGLPLALKLVGGLLGAKSTSYEWKKVRQNVESYRNLHKNMVHENVVLYPNNIKGSEEIKNISPILELAYNALPHYLKQCFLYLGMFPEDAVIEAERLYLHWFAEGMIPYRDGESKVTMMDIAEGYLYELAVRSMVLVQEEDTPNIRRFKSCRLNNLMRGLCLLKRKEEDFFDVIYFRRANHMGICSHSHFSTLEISRLAVYFEDGCVVPVDWNTDMYPWSMSLKNPCQYQQAFMSMPEFSLRRDLTRLRVLCLSGFNFEVLRLPSIRAKLIPPQFLSLRDLPQVLSDFAEFRRLRVLDISGFNFKVTRLPGGIEKLSRLRYLSLSSCNITRLPSSICSLFNLETLYLRDCPRMIIPNELQKLIKLRYLYLPRSFKVHGEDKLHVGALRELETLVNFDSRVCKTEDLFKLTKLRKLAATIEDNLEDLEAITGCINMNLTNLRLSSLVVRNLDRCSGNKSFVRSNLFESVNLHRLHVEGYIGKLPQSISSSLSKISFSGSELEEDPLQKLGGLPNLLVLVLRKNAFLGKHMICASSGMPRLKCLTLSNLLSLENLTFEKGGMPKLCTLAIENCQSLVELPEGLNFLTSLQQLRLAWMAPSFLNKLHQRGENSYEVR